MLIIDIEEAKNRLSKLVDMAAQGKSFMISEDGKPVVKVSAFDANDAVAVVLTQTPE